MRNTVFPAAKIWKKKVRSDLLKKHLFFSITAIVFALDLGVKYLVKYILSDPFGSITVIPGFFRIVYVENHGLLFGFFSRMPLWIKLAAMLVGILFLGYYVFRHYNEFLKGELWAFALIFGGGLGNIIDRMINGAVFDFLLLFIKNRQWPTFNIADICIDVGIGLYILMQFTGRKNAS